MPRATFTLFATVPSTLFWRKGFLPSSFSLFSRYSRMLSTACLYSTEPGSALRPTKFICSILVIGVEETSTGVVGVVGAAVGAATVATEGSTSDLITGVAGVIVCPAAAAAAAACASGDASRKRRAGGVIGGGAGKRRGAGGGGGGTSRLAGSLPGPRSPATPPIAPPTRKPAAKESIKDTRSWLVSPRPGIAATSAPIPIASWPASVIASRAPRVPAVPATRRAKLRWVPPRSRRSTATNSGSNSKPAYGTALPRARKRAPTSSGSTPASRNRP